MNSSRDVANAFKSIIFAKRKLKKNPVAIAHPVNESQCEQLRILLLSIPKFYCFIQQNWLPRILMISEKYKYFIRNHKLIEITQAYSNEPNYIPELDMTLIEFVDYFQHNLQLQEIRQSEHKFTWKEDLITDENILDVEFDINDLFAEDDNEFDIPLPIQISSLAEDAVEISDDIEMAIAPPIDNKYSNLPSIFDACNNSTSALAEYFILNKLLPSLLNGTCDAQLLSKYKIANIPFVPTHESISDTMLSVPMFKNEKDLKVRQFPQIAMQIQNNECNPHVLIHKLMPYTKKQRKTPINYKLQFNIYGVNCMEGSKIRFLENSNTDLPILLGSSLTTNSSLDEYGNVYFVDCNSAKIHFPKIHIGHKSDNQPYTAGVGIAHTYGSNKSITIGQDGSMELWEFKNNKLSLNTPIMENKCKFFDEMTDVHAYCVDKHPSYQMELAITSADPKTNRKGISIFRVDLKDNTTYDLVGKSQCKYDDGDGIKITALEFGRRKNSNLLFASYAKIQDDQCMNNNIIKRWDKLDAKTPTVASVNMPSNYIEICSLKASPKGTWLGIGCTDSKMNWGLYSKKWPGYLMDPHNMEVALTYDVEAHDNNYVSFDPNENFILFANSTDRIRVFDIRNNEKPLLELFHALPLKTKQREQQTEHQLRLNLLRKIGPRNKCFIEMGDLLNVDDAHISYCGVNQNSIHWISDHEFVTPAFGGIYFYDLLQPDPLFHKIPVEQPLNSFAIHADGYLAYTDVMRNFYFYSALDVKFPKRFDKITEEYVE